MARQIYRQSALSRLSSPEEIDQLISIFKPKAWLSLATLSGIVLCAVLWSIFGSISTTVSGSGILLKAGGIYDVASLGSGVLTEIRVSVGDNIKTDQIIAVISQPALLQEIEQTEDQVELLQDKMEELTSYYNSSGELEEKNILQEEVQLSKNVESTGEKLLWLKEKVNSQKEAFELGIITKDQLQNSIQMLRSSEAELSNLEIRFEALNLKKLSLKMREDRDITDLDQQIIATERQIAALRLNLTQSSQIASPYSGVVQEIKVNEGELINRGLPIISLEKSESSLMVLGYIPVVGQKVKPGMEAQISPATVKKEEFGFMYGNVLSVSGLPTTRQGMMKTLKNDLLVEQLAGKGPPFTIEIELSTNSSTFSGYKWSSKKGPPVEIKSGNICELRVVVREQRPITLALPILKKTFGLM